MKEELNEIQHKSKAIPVARWFRKRKQPGDENFRPRTMPTNELLMGCWHDYNSTVTFKDNAFFLTAYPFTCHNSKWKIYGKHEPDI